MVVVTVVMDLLPQSLHAVLFDAEADEHFLTLASSYRNLSGGGRARNRRRKSIAIGIYDHLIGRLTDHSELLDLVRARRAEVLSPDFEATQSTCLFNVSEPAQAAAPVEVAAPVTPPIDAPGAVIVDLLEEGSPERSRSPISASAILSSTPKPPGPRPRAGGIRTPVPPTPRPKYLGVRTPSPPRVDPGSRYIVTRPKRRPRPIEDGSSDDYHSEFPSIEESFVPKASGVPISSGYIGDWTSEQWREYNQRQEAASSSADRAVPAPTGSTLQPLRVLQCFNAPAAFARDLEQALEYRGGVRYILSLDYHGVFDRCYQSTGELLRNLDDRPEVLVLLCSKCSTDELIENAVTAVGDLCRTNGYGARHFPCLFIPRPDKSAKLWQALSLVSALERLPLMHVDDKWSIVEDFNRWDIESWRGIHLPVRGRRELAEVVLPAIAEWR